MKTYKLRKKLRKTQPNFQHYVKKIEARAKKWFSYKKKRVYKKKPESIPSLTPIYH